MQPARQGPGAAPKKGKQMPIAMRTTVRTKTSTIANTMIIKAFIIIPIAVSGRATACGGCCSYCCCCSCSCCCFCCKCGAKEAIKWNCVTNNTQKRWPKLRQARKIYSYVCEGGPCEVAAGAATRISSSIL